MKTQILKIEKNNINSNYVNKAAQILQHGGLVAFPTETVYGIGANALDKASVLKIYEAKGRPSDNPLIIHIARKEEVYLYAKDISIKAKRLMDKFWPGPLTLIFNRTELICDFITGGLNTVAIRIPSNEIARQIIEASRLPIAAPSANRSGKPSPTNAKHVIEDLNGRVDMIIDGGSSYIGLESTVLDVTGDIPVILRPGFVTQRMLIDEVGQVIYDKALTNTNKHQIPKAPGMKYKHYAPNGHLTVIDGEQEKAISYINEEVKEKEFSERKTAVIATKEDAHLYECDHIIVIGSRNDGNEIASNLFKVLRLMDEKEIEFIYTRAFSEADIGSATMNRLLKAAGNSKIIV